MKGVIKKSPNGIAIINKGEIVLKNNKYDELISEELKDNTNSYASLDVTN